MSDFDVNQYNEIIAKTRSMIDKVIQDYNIAVQRIRSDFSEIPILGNEISQSLESCEEHFNSLIEKFQYYLRAAEVPITLSKLGDSWHSMAIEAGDSASRLALIKQYQDEWTGIAGGKYQAAVSNQEPAMDQIQSRANQISSACNSAAQAGKTFYIALAVAAVALGAAIAGAGTGIAIVLGITTCIVAIMTALSSLMMGAQTQVRALQAAGEPSDAFPGGTWPSSTNR